jgi:hypothetical protein
MIAFPCFFLILFLLNYSPELLSLVNCAGLLRTLPSCCKLRLLPEGAALCGFLSFSLLWPALSLARNFQSNQQIWQGFIFGSQKLDSAVIIATLQSLRS